MRRKLIGLRSLNVYVSYFFITCLYVIFIRLKDVPMALAYALYGMAIVCLFYELIKGGIRRFAKKWDVILASFFATYYIISSLIYVAFNENDASWLLKDYLYSLLPILVYIILRLSKMQINVHKMLFLSWFSIIIIDIISLFLFLSPDSFVSNLFREESVEFQGTILIALSGILGVILTGFVNVIGLTICLFSPIKLNKIVKIISIVFFVVCIFLTGQRTPIVGLVLLLIIILLKNRGKGLVAIGCLCLLFSFIYKFANIEVEGVSVKDNMLERTVYRFSNMKSGDTGRNDQYKIYNDENVFWLLFGDGVGRHSPENEKSIHSMPDAMLFRIFNEMGIVGLILFLAFFYFNFIKAVKTKNWFMISLILYIFIANSTNRVLFAAPMSILPYFILALYNWNAKDCCKCVQISNR